jgi:ribosomal protein S2
MYYKKKEKKIKNKYLISDIILTQLVKSKNHYGSLNKFFKPENKPYIHGFKFNQSIIDVIHTLFSFKVITKFIKKYCKLYSQKKILIICSDYEKKNINNVLKKNSRVSHKFEVKSKWEKGFLIRNEDKYGLIIMFSSKDFKIIANEIEFQKLPVIYFLNTDMPLIRLSQISYPIFYNNGKFESIYFMFSFLIKIFTEVNVFKI